MGGDKMFEKYIGEKREEGLKDLGNVFLPEKIKKAKSIANSGHKVITNKDFNIEDYEAYLSEIMDRE